MFERLCNKKNEVSLLAIGIILSSIGLVQALSYPLDLRASNDSESGTGRSHESSFNRVR